MLNCCCCGLLDLPLGFFFLSFSFLDVHGIFIIKYLHNLSYLMIETLSNIASKYVAYLIPSHAEIEIKIYKYNNMNNKVNDLQVV